MFALHHPTSVLMVGNPVEGASSAHTSLTTSPKLEHILDYDLAVGALRTNVARNKAFDPTIELDEQRSARAGYEMLLRLSCPSARPDDAGASLENTYSVVLVNASAIDHSAIRFAQRLLDCPVRKLLITKKDQAPVAITAVNHRLFDSVLFVGDPDFENRLATEVRSLKREFFDQRNARWRHILETGPAGFLRSASARKLIAEVAHDTDTQYVYLSLDPPGVLRTGPGTNRDFILICDADYQRAHREIAESEAAPLELVEALNHSETIAWFPRIQEFLQTIRAGDWRNHTWRGNRLADDPRWLYAKIAESSANKRLFEHLQKVLTA